MLPNPLGTPLPDIERVKRRESRSHHKPSIVYESFTNNLTSPVDSHVKVHQNLGMNSLLQIFLFLYLLLITRSNWTISMYNLLIIYKYLTSPFYSLRRNYKEYTSYTFFLNSCSTWFLYNSLIPTWNPQWITEFITDYYTNLIKK